MYNQQTAEIEKPMAAYYLTLIGSILGIIAGIFLLVILIGIWVIIANVITIIYAQKLLEEPLTHSKWGNYIIIFAVLSGLNILSLIGGILATIYTPARTNISPNIYSTYPQQRLTRFCPQCGALVSEDSRFCSHCGKQLP